MDVAGRAQPAQLRSLVEVLAHDRRVQAGRVFLQKEAAASLGNESERLRLLLADRLLERVRCAQ